MQRKLRRLISIRRMFLWSTCPTASNRCTRGEIDVVTLVQRIAIDSKQPTLRLHSLLFTTCVPADGGIE